MSQENSTIPFPPDGFRYSAAAWPELVLVPVMTGVIDTDTADKVAATRRAFMRYVQGDNQCAATGKACRDGHRCGCWLEMENAIRAEQ